MQQPLAQSFIVQAMTQFGGANDIGDHDRQLTATDVSSGSFCAGTQDASAIAERNAEIDQVRVAEQMQYISVNVLPLKQIRELN